MHTDVSTETNHSEARTASVWRNWYRSLIDHETSHAGAKRAGDEWPGGEVFSSKEEAEGQALVFMELRAMIPEENGEPEPTEYLGAYREDDAV